MPDLSINRGETIKTMGEKIHANAVLHGWWETPRTIPELLVLIHSEVSEALEAFRDNDMVGFAEELADVAIRLLDAAEGYQIDLEHEIQAKHELNINRPFRHGGKLL